MTKIVSTRELTLKSDEFKDESLAGKTFVVISFGHYSVDHGSVAKFITKYITEKGGIVRASAVRNLDYAIVCTRVNKMYMLVSRNLFDWPDIEEGGCESRKEGSQIYNAARKLQREGKDVRIISDIDLFLHEHMFSLLPAFDKKRLISECCKGNKSFSDQDNKVVAAYLRRNIVTDTDFEDLRNEGLDLKAFLSVIDNAPVIQSSLLHKTVVLGKYEIKSEGSENQIKWIIIHEEEESVLLISKDVLEFAKKDITKPGDYHYFNFSDSKGRPFYPSAFSPEELSNIVESDISKPVSKAADANTEQPETVFFLSKQECNLYFTGQLQDDLKAKPTPYLYKRMDYSVQHVSKDSASWYLRTFIPGSQKRIHSAISRNGHYTQAYYDGSAARPAIRIKKSYVPEVLEK